MNDKLRKLINENIKDIDEKNQQTTYKIKYISNYVENWARVLSNAEYTDRLVFIDCMCNAGIYKDGDFCTAIEVLKIFKKFAYSFPEKKYCLYVNDLSKKRMKIFKKVVEVVLGESLLENLEINYNNMDVNEYVNLQTTKHTEFNYPNVTILYVDPYDFGTVHIPTLRKFAEKYYCEIIFNLFTSDFVRNQMDERILKIIDNEKVNIYTKNQLVDYIIKQLKVNKMKYSFQYAFRIKTNVELYQIMFLTPNKKGLDELKNAIWETFKGEAFHRNNNLEDGGTLQLTLFDEKDDIKMKLNEYGEEAIFLLLNHFKGKTLSFSEISDFILPISMLRSTDLIEYLLKPAIARKKITKLNQVKNKSNYKEDFYLINEVI